MVTQHRHAIPWLPGSPPPPCSAHLSLCDFPNNVQPQNRGANVLNTHCIIERLKNQQVNVLINDQQLINDKLAISVTAEPVLNNVWRVKLARPPQMCAAVA